jgi:hypothetical protein
MSNVIKEAKRLHYDKQITNSNNKIKTTRKIVNSEMHRKASTTTTESLSIDGMFINNQQHIADTFNNYFVSIADNINNNNNDVYTQNKYNHKNDHNISFLQSMSQIYKPMCSKIKQKPTKTFEIEKII